MIKAAIYARYSSDLQSDASIEDQIRLSTGRAAQEGWTITQPYTDHGMSGASMLRTGMQMLMQDAMAGKFILSWQKRWIAYRVTRKMSPVSISACNLLG